MYCRLCLTEPAYDCETRSIFNGFDNLAEIIAQHFSFEPKKEDTHKIICMNCLEIVENFHIFYIKIEEAQKCLEPEMYIKLEESIITKIGPDDSISEKENESDEDISKSLLNSLTTTYEETEPQQTHDTVIASDIPKRNRRQLQKLQYYSQSDECDEVNKEVENENKKNISKKVKSKKKPVLKKPKIVNDIDDFIDKEEDDNHDDIDDIYKKSEKFDKKSFDDIDKKIANFMKLRCDICLKEETTFTNIKKHFRAEHNVNGYVICCDKKFDKRIYLADHVQTHLNPEHFKCKICNRNQSNHNSLRQHIKVVHNTPKIWECDVCKKKMANRSALELHKYTHIPIEERTFKCSDCEKIFASEIQMKMHWTKVHESFSNNICYVCGKIIKDMVLFKKHQLEHLGIVEPKAQCETCGIWLKNVSSLRKHIRNLHSEEDVDHICNVCDKVCKTRAALKSHKFYVHSSRTYPCTVCGKEFKKTITLKEHMSTHTGEVLYTCPHCPKTFTSNANLHHHRKKNHFKEWEEKRASKMQPPVKNDETLVGKNDSYSADNSLGDFSTFN